MKHFCWLIRLLFLLLVILLVPATETRALRSHTQQSDIIAGNEFLKLFLKRDEQQRDLHSSEYQEGGRDVVSYYDNDENNGSNDAASKRDIRDGIASIRNERSHSASVRSLENINRNSNLQTRGDGDGHKSQVVKLVTSGSKIVFLEDEYDEDDAVVDAAKIELKKERMSHDKATPIQQPEHAMNDEIKVVAVSVSSSSHRAHAHASKSYSPRTLSKHVNNISDAATTGPQETHQHKSHNSSKNTSSNSQSLASKKSTSSTISPLTVTTTTTTTTTTPPPETLDFINRSHKSELLIEETEPLTMLKNAHSFSTSTHLFHDTDSENSASTNIRNVLAVPAVGEDTLSNSSTRIGSRINQSSARSRSFTHSGYSSTTTTTTAPPNLSEDKLLPFQTVIYHDTREGHGPQSRSISYSSISQNVEDLQNWQKSGILAEAQRNVSESLKPLPRPPSESEKHTHISEPAKFYSLPAQMYSVPAKFYSEPAKVYSEPAKVYGQPEKIYSEPAKVYGQPAKFYSEPAKVYSQPSKVYSEPAKTYWPRPSSVPTTSSTTTAATTSSLTAFITTTAAPFATSSSRRPAIVSRIAFGEAQTTQVPTDAGQHRQTQSQHHYTNPQSQNINHNQQQLQQQRHQFHRGSQSDNANSKPRRVLFNLDRLPYDLLNAPEQTAEHHISSPIPAGAATAAASSGSYNVGRQRPCWEPPTSSVASPQHQPHSSLLLDEHSNQNAKGLPNRDLVKCVSKYSHSPPASLSKRPNAYTITTSTTESSHIAELYTPTSEQNYEIEESVSVMTNGRAHGAQLFGGPTTATTTTRSHLRGGSSSSVDSARQSGGLHYVPPLYNTNANTNADDVEQTTDENYDEDQSDGNGNNNENYYDDANANGSGDKHNSSNNNGKDDSKVAYVLEGRNFRKYRVEEKTDDGFIVGEYGVVDHQDGNLRGVRYTADSTINRSLIQKALLTFLKLK